MGEITNFKTQVETANKPVTEHEERLSSIYDVAVGLIIDIEEGRNFFYVRKHSSSDESYRNHMGWILNMKNQSFNIANMPQYGYIHQALCKITKLALVGYLTKGAYSPLRAFFMRNISMHLHFMAELERDTFTCAGSLLYLSTNPFQLCHPHLVVNGKAPDYKERINHA